jgi:hypothetical protein
MVRRLKSSDFAKKRNIRTGIRINNAKVKKQQVWFSRKQLVLVFALLLVFMGSGIGYVWSNFEGTQIGYDLSRLKKEELRLKEFNIKLRLELATLKSPQYLEEATRVDGLRPTVPGQTVFLK